MVVLKYPSVDEIIEFNFLVLDVLKVKKADEPKVLSRSKILESIKMTQNYEGNLYSKAAVLMERLVRGHAFASGNRRTAFVVVKQFVVKNGGKFSVPDNPSIANVMIGIREKYYSLVEIENWIKDGKIREFKDDGGVLK